MTSSSRRMTQHSKAWHCILLASMMKLVYLLVVGEFRTLDPGNFHLENNTESENSGPSCSLEGSKPYDPSDFGLTFTEWVYVGRYMLPIVGGALSSAWLGCKRVLQIGGFVMLLSTVLLSGAVQLGLVCQRSGMTDVAWLAVPLFVGLIHSNINLAMFRWYRKDKLCTVVSLIYYAAFELGDLMSVPLLQLACFRAFGQKFTLVFIALSVLFLILTLLLPEVREDEAFELPTIRRMVKYFQVFSALILFLAFQSEAREKVYVAEMSYFLNATVDIAKHPWLSPNCVQYFSMLVLMPPFILFAFRSPRRLSVSKRLLPGILLKAAVELFLAVVTALGLSNASATVAVYTTVSILDGVSEMLVMVAAYDLGCSILPGSAQCLILGVMFTVWGLRYFFGRLVLLVVDEISGRGQKPLFCVYHLIAIPCLLSCFTYHKFVTLPIASQLSEFQDSAAHDGNVSEVPDSNSEQRPLLNAV